MLSPLKGGGASRRSRGLVDGRLTERVWAFCRRGTPRSHPGGGGVQQGSSTRVPTPPSEERGIPGERR